MIIYTFRIHILSHVIQHLYKKLHYNEFYITPYFFVEIEIYSLRFIARETETTFAQVTQHIS